MATYSGTVRHPVYIGPKDRIEPGTTFGSSVAVIDCPAFAAFPEGTTFGSSVAVIDCPAFAAFPEGTTFASSVEVIDCPAFAAFPEGTTFASSVAVIDCPAFVGSPGCELKGHPIAYGEEADRRIRNIATIVLGNPRLLEMGSWHDQHCNTVHCVAGHGVHQEGREGYALERALGGEGDGTRAAGTILLGLEAAGHFYDNNETALAWLRSKLEAASC